MNAVVNNRSDTTSNHPDTAVHALAGCFNAGHDTGDDAGGPRQREHCERRWSLTVGSSPGAIPSNNALSAVHLPEGRNVSRWQWVNVKP